MPRCDFNKTCQKNGARGRRGYCELHFQRALKAEGKTQGTVPVTGAAEHIRYLMESGLTQFAIARTAGVSSYTLNRIRHGARETILAETARRILAVHPKRVIGQPGGSLMASTGLVRRLRALNAIGYSAARLARELGMSDAQVERYLKGVELVRVESDRAVRELFDRLQLCPLPRGRYGTSQAMNSAAKRGWAPPLAWDENSIDDPGAVPFGVRGGELVKLPRVARIEDYVEMRSWGLSDAQVAERMGVGKTYLMQLVAS